MNTVLADIYWATWFVLGFGGFEGWALASGQPQYTLSDTTWRWFDVVPGQTIWQWSIVHLVFAFFLTWAWLHLVLHMYTVWGGRL